MWSFSTKYDKNLHWKDNSRELPLSFDDTHSEKVTLGSLIEEVLNINVWNTSQTLFFCGKIQFPRNYPGNEPLLNSFLKYRHFFSGFSTPKIPCFGLNSSYSILLRANFLSILSHLTPTDKSPRKRTLIGKFQ